MNLRSLTAAALLFAGGLSAQSPMFEITAPMQAEIDHWKKVAAKWAENEDVVAAVQAQNKLGPVAGMTKKKWKKVPDTDKLVVGLKTNKAAKALIKGGKASDKIVNEVFLNALKGEKVAFQDKTSSYVHKGKKKFDVPHDTKKPWQGSPGFDESTSAFSLQISVPVFEPEKDPKKVTPLAEKKVIGVLVVGIDLTTLKKKCAAAKPGQ